MLFGRNKKNPIKLPAIAQNVEKWVYTTCGYCSTGCSIEVGVDKEGRGVTSRGVGDADVNRGKLCLKGIMEHELFNSANRGNTPLIREKIIDEYEPASWDSALDKTASEIKRIQEKYGRDSFAIVSTGQILTEEFYT
ncbi:MAG: molybdopterin-dependent oxidoreductase, partial [Gammaproteobacteria bacterium]|nr:molybdopterin-dependent oxidoreductase [Gammaproteobacteria bacterium]